MPGNFIYCQRSTLWNIECYFYYRFCCSTVCVCLSHHVFTMLFLQWQTTDFCNIHLSNYIEINWFSNDYRDDRVMDCSVRFTGLQISQLKCGTTGILIIVFNTPESWKSHTSIVWWHCYGHRMSFVIGIDWFEIHQRDESRDGYMRVVLRAISDFLLISCNWALTLIP